MTYLVTATPGMGIGIICDRCDGEDRDLLGFGEYRTEMTIEEFNDHVTLHEAAFHLKTEIW